MAPKKKTAWGDRSDSDEPPSPLAVASKKSAPDLPAIDEPGRTNPSKPGAKGGGGGGAADVAAAVQKLSAAEAHTRVICARWHVAETLGRQYQPIHPGGESGAGGRNAEAGALTNRRAGHRRAPWPDDARGRAMPMGRARRPPTGVRRCDRRRGGGRGRRAGGKRAGVFAATRRVHGRGTRRVVLAGRGNQPKLRSTALGALAHTGTHTARALFHVSLPLTAGTCLRHPWQLSVL